MSDTRDINGKIDYSLLFFLVGVTYVKIYVKIAAILFYLAYIIYKKYELQKLISINRFYFIIPVIGTIGSLIHHSFGEKGYWFGWLFSVMYWVLAGITSYFLYIAVTNNTKQDIHSTLKAFFAINMVVSLLQLVHLMQMSHHFMPYWYWDATEYFGSSTGDHIYGIFSNISVTNAMISAIGSIYFLFQRNFYWAAICLFVMLLCTSNLTLLLFLLFLSGIFIITKHKHVRINAILLLLTAVIVYPILSPQNLTYVDSVYVEETTKEPSKIVIADKLKIKPWEGESKKNDLEKAFSSLNASITSKINYYRLPFNEKKMLDYSTELKYMHYQKKIQNKQDNVALLNPVILKSIITEWYGIPYENTPLTTYNKPIKLYSNIQTLAFLYENPVKNFFGAGIGNFSSKQSIKMLGIDMQGSYPKEYIYVSDDFFRYHLYSFFYVFSLPIADHSIVNMINSVYNQVGGEYGIAGILAFIFMYLGYFWKNRKMMSTMGISIVLMMLLFFNFDYWFEMLSLTVIFELLLFIDIYKRKTGEQ